MNAFYQDILLGGSKGKPAFRKSNFYFKLGPHAGIAAEPDPEKHRITRKWMAPAFSPRALKEQDPILHKVVDNAIDKMALKGGGPEGIDMTLVSYFVQHPKSVNGPRLTGEINSGATSSPATWLGAWASATTIRTSRTRSLLTRSNGSTTSPFGSRWTRPSSDSRFSTPLSTSRYRSV